MRLGVASAISMAAMVMPTAASGQPQYTLSGGIASDVRFVVEDNRGAAPGEGYYFSRNRNNIDLTLDVTAEERVTAKGHIRFTFFGFSHNETLDDITAKETIDPYRLESDAAYINLKSHTWKSLNVRAGRQIVTWGTADQFSPTDNLNARDFEDTTRFGAKLANQMLRMDFDTGPVRWQAVWVPVFRPALLPASAHLGISDVNDVPFQAQADKDKIVELFDELGQGIDVPPLYIRPSAPEPSLSNGMAGLRAGATFGSLDLSLSWFYGRHPTPVPKRVKAAFGDNTPGRDNVWGTPDDKRVVLVKADTIYPRQMVAGADMAASLPWLFDIGVWAEFAVVVPEEIELVIETPPPAPEIRGLVNPDTPYLKFTAGFDYSFTSWWYLNAQFVRGFFDEYGKGNLDDFAVAGMDFKFFDDELTTRFFAIVDVNDQSTILLPQIIVTPFAAVEITAGALIFTGEKTTKFGHPRNGRSEAFAKLSIGF